MVKPFPLAVLVLLLPLLQGGCENVSWLSGGHATPQANNMAPPVDPVLAFVARAKPGEGDILVSTGGDEVAVQVTQQYFAASNQLCRRYTLHKVGINLQESGVACRGADGVWAPVRLAAR